MTTLHDFGGVLGRPWGTFFWALTVSWSRLLARGVKWPYCKSSSSFKVTALCVPAWVLGEGKLNFCGSSQVTSMLISEWVKCGRKHDGCQVDMHPKASNAALGVVLM